jgi:hypothetical protein
MILLATCNEDVSVEIHVGATIIAMFLTVLLSYLLFFGKKLKPKIH